MSHTANFVAGPALANKALLAIEGTIPKALLKKTQGSNRYAPEEYRQMRERQEQAIRHVIETGKPDHELAARWKR